MDIDQSAAIIRQIVQESGEITGSQLARKIRSLAPEWSAQALGSDGLRSFIEAHVAGVVVAGRSGMDLTYKHRLTSSPRDQKQLWTTWVSPFGRYALFVESQTAQVEQLPRAATPPQGAYRLTLPSEENHLAIARAFLEEMEQTQTRPHLSNFLANPERQWWRQWYSELRKIGHLNEWKAFRQARLEELLREHLREFFNENLGNERLGAIAFDTITQTNQSSLAAAKALPSSVDSTLTLRQSLIAAVNNMDEWQLKLTHSLLDVISHALDQRSK